MYSTIAASHKPGSEIRPSGCVTRQRAWGAGRLEDAGISHLHRGLAAELALVLGVLGDLDLLDDLTDGGTVTGPVLAHDTDLLGALRHPAIYR